MYHTFFIIVVNQIMSKLIRTVYFRLNLQYFWYNNGYLMFIVKLYISH